VCVVCSCLVSRVSLVVRVSPVCPLARAADRTANADRTRAGVSRPPAAPRPPPGAFSFTYILYYTPMAMPNCNVYRFHTGPTDHHDRRTNVEPLTVGART